MDPLAPGEIDGYTKDPRMARMAGHTLVLRSVGLSLAVIAFPGLLGYGMLTGSLRASHVPWLAAALLVGMALIMVSWRTLEFCRGCGRPAEKRSHREVRDTGEFHGYVTFCRTCRTYQSHMTHSD